MSKEEEKLNNDPQVMDKVIIPYIGTDMISTGTQSSYLCGRRRNGGEDAYVVEGISERRWEAASELCLCEQIGKNKKAVNLKITTGGVLTWGKDKEGHVMWIQPWKKQVCLPDAIYRP